MRQNINMIYLKDQFEQSLSIFPLTFYFATKGNQIQNFEKKNYFEIQTTSDLVYCKLLHINKEFLCRSYTKFHTIYIVDISSDIRKHPYFFIYLNISRYVPKRALKGISIIIVNGCPHVALCDLDNSSASRPTSCGNCPFSDRVL